MKTLLVTIVTEAIAEHARLFVKNQREYASHHGFEYRVVQDTHWKDLHPSFSKVWAIGQGLEEGHDYVIWADADVLFTNYATDLTKLAEGKIFIAGYQQQNWKTWKYICAGLLVVRNCFAACQFVDEWDERCRNGSSLIHPGKRTRVLHHPWEQWYFDELIREHEYRGIRACTAEEIGCFCKEVWTDGVDWKPGMPTLHMAGPATWEQRAAVLPLYLSQIMK